MTLKEMRASLDAKRAALNAIYDEAGGAGNMDLDKITSIKGDASAKLSEMRQRNEELERLQKDAEAMAEIEAARKAQAVDEAKREDAARSARDAGTPAAATPGTKDEPVNIGREIVKLARERKGQTFTTEVKGVEPGRFKANFVTTAGWPPESVRIPGLVIADAHQEPMLIDVVPSATTSQAMVKYMEESTYTPAAAERAEAAAYPEATFALTERNYPVRVVGHRVPVSDEQLEDVEGAESYLNTRLIMGIRGARLRPDSEGRRNRCPDCRSAGSCRRAEQRRATEPAGEQRQHHRHHQAGRNRGGDDRIRNVEPGGHASRGLGHRSSDQDQRWSVHLGTPGIGRGQHPVGYPGGADDRAGQGEGAYRRHPLLRVVRTARHRSRNGLHRRRLRERYADYPRGNPRCNGAVPGGSVHRIREPEGVSQPNRAGGKGVKMPLSAVRPRVMVDSGSTIRRR